MLDLDQFIKIYAMEFLLKHWDGYSDNTNNTYVYNDLTAVAAPGPGNVKFKLIPWGIDQILQPQHSFKMSTNGLIAKLVRNDAGRRAQLVDQIRKYRDTIFAREVQQATLKPMIDRMEALLVGFGVPNAVAQIAVVRQQLRLAASAGYLCAGLPETRPVYVLKDDTSECLHASNTEGIPAGQPNPVNFEIYHRPLPDNNDPSDLWHFGTLGSGKSLTNQANGRVLHASATQITAKGHKYLYTCAPATATAPKSSRRPRPGARDGPRQSAGRFAYTGYFNLVSLRTDRWRNTGSTSRRAAGPGFIRNFPAPTSISTDHLRSSDTCALASAGVRLCWRPGEPACRQQCPIEDVSARSRVRCPSVAGSTASLHTGQPVPSEFLRPCISGRNSQEVRVTGLRHWKMARFAVLQHPGLSLGTSEFN